MFTELFLLCLHIELLANYDSYNKVFLQIEKKIYSLNLEYICWDKSPRDLIAKE